MCPSILLLRRQGILQEANLCDANVIIRYITKDTKHPKYVTCCELLKQELLVRYYVLPEVTFQFLAYYRKIIAKSDAKKDGTYDEFLENSRAYLSKHQPPAHWRQDAYEMFELAMNKLLSTFPSVQIANFDLFEKTLQIAKQTGFDWVDCTLLAENQLYGHSIVSVDKDIPKGLKALQAKAASSGVKPLSFT